MEKLKKLAGVIFGLSLPLIVSAQQILPPNNISNYPGNTGSRFTDIVFYLIRIALGITGIIAVAFIIYGGFRYITSAGNDEAAEGAKKTIINAIIGLIVVILSYVIISVVVNALLPNGAGV
jgi:type IV secretion system pilin